MGERWRSVFDKIFEELRTNHPADEWTLRLVDQLVTSKGVEDEPPTTELPAEEVTADAADKEIYNLEVAATLERASDDEIQKAAQQVDGESSSSSSDKGDDGTVGEFINSQTTSDHTETKELQETINSADMVDLENPLNVSQQEKAAEPLDMQRDQPVEPDNNILVVGHEDNQIDGRKTENLVDQVEAVQLHLEAAGETAKQENQEEINASPDEAVEKIQEAETGSSVCLEARDSDAGQHIEPEKENEPTLIQNDQETLEKPETEQEIVSSDEEKTSESVHIQEIPADQQQEINETLAVLDAVTTEISSSSSIEETTKVSTTETQNVQTQPETKDEIIECNKNEVEETRVEQIIHANGHQEQIQANENNVDEAKVEEKETIPLVSATSQPASDEPIETHFDSANLDLPQVIYVNGEQAVGATEEVVKDGLLTYNERLISDDDPPRQVEELEITPVQITSTRPVQRLGASTPHLAASSNGDGQFKETETSSKKSPSKAQENELIRKPEWMRRPLVRKGSVGRFLGRMKETMQSKRFHPDRLPVVPPPQPEPPKRPPRRKTLANLDLSRESETTSREQSLLNSPPLATPKSAPVSEFENKSATLRSNVSDRKRKNSIGRFIGRVLSTRHLNTTEGTAAEEAPLLNQEPQSTPQQQPPRSPTTPRSSTPVPSEKSKKGAAMAVNDMGIFIRRILRPKTAAADEAKDKLTPQRPPPPSRHQTPIPNETSLDNKDDQNKSVIKRGKVHFECQVFLPKLVFLFFKLEYYIY